MRSVFLPASVLAALCLIVPGLALAQTPEQPPPAENPRTPPPRDYAVPRAEAPRSETIVVREPQSDSGARENNSTGDQGNRRRPPTASRESAPPPPPPPSSGAASSSSGESSDQGAERRGAVRRPPSDSNAGRGQVTRDRAVARSSVPPRDRDGNHVYVYPDYWSYGRYYDPYYASGFHLGYLAYSPWGWTPAFYGYPYGAYGYGGYGYGGYGAQHGYDLGALKIKVTPRDAEVYVDGYFAGQVDDFDGFWQSLKLDSGGYRIEIRKPGFETLQFDVHVQPDRTITYRGDLRPTP
jgi:hypothetical protein